MVTLYIDNIKEEIHRKPLIWYNKMIYKNTIFIAYFIVFCVKTA